MLFGYPPSNNPRWPACDENGHMLHAPVQCRSTGKSTDLASIPLQYGTIDENSEPQVHQMKCVQSAFRKMIEHLSSVKPEAAAILLGPREEPGLVTHVVPDLHGEGTPASFRLDVKTLNKRLKVAKVAEMCCIGIVHSHPHHFTRPSAGDLAYLQSLFEMPKNDASHPFFVPIFCGGKLYPYAYLGGEIHPAQLLLI